MPSKVSLPRLIKLLPLSLLLAGMSVTFLLPAVQSLALSGSDFHAGHIIDDVIFTNSNAMSVSQIQSFLNSKVSCDTNGTQSKSYYYNSNTGRVNNSADTWVTTSRAVYGQRYDKYYGTSKAAAPYVCLPQYVENPSTQQNNLQNPSASVPWGESAAQIIYNAAQQYQINPEVLITTLQKEQGLVTDDWPWTNEYQIAMGYGCPDTSGCDSQYYGFANQVNNAAAQFRRYLTNPNNYNYVVGSDYIQYNPDSGCGGTTVNIQNQATAALYDYTPYQPNAAALKNVSDSNSGGTGDSCSAYGNRNFWWYFNEWFGTSLASGYAWQPIQQSVYTDSSMSATQDPTNLLPNQRFYVVIKAENTGTVTWQKGVYGRQVNVGTDNPRDRKSAFCDSTWGSNCNRAGTSAEATIAPGQTGTFGFWATAPGYTGTYNEYFNLVMDGTSWMSNDPGLYWTFAVKQPTWQPVQQSAYTDSSMSTPVNTDGGLLPNQRYYLVLKAKNTGVTTWQKGVAGRQVNLGTQDPRDRKSAFCDSTWGSSCNRPGTSSESTVAPGGTGTFGFWINTPSSTGAYYEHYGLVMDGTSWMNNPEVYWTLKVNPITVTWQPVQQSAYTDSSMSTPVNTLALQAGQRYYLLIKAKNTGNITWQKGVAGRQVNVGTDNPRDRKSAFCDSTWGTNCNRPGTSTEASVAPGADGTFGFWITAPSQKGTYNEYFNLVMDGTTWANNDPGLYWTLKVN